MIGQTIGPYRVEEELGRGGMGIVYRARDVRLGRSVALKFLPAELLTQAERRSRVLAEARAAAALNHPGITTIYDVVEHEGQVCIAMELVSGRTLRDLLGEGRVDPRRVARIGAELAETLEAAHSENVVHGDLKPENVIQQSSGRLKLVDFGIARQRAQENITSATLPAAVADSGFAGTIAYLAPEVLNGQPADRRADLYALGVMLFELAAGHRPFAAPTVAALIAQVMHQPPPALETAAPHVPAELARIVHRLLEKEPEARPRSAREVHADLVHLIRTLEAGLPSPSGQESKRAVAVLPFRLLTPGPDDEFLSVALADAVIHQLGSSGDLLVRPASLVVRYARQQVDPRIAARELGVQMLVEGSIQKAGQRLRVMVQAWNAADGSTLLTAKYDGDTTDLFALQDQIATELADLFRLHRRLARAAESDRAPVQPPTKSPLAYELVLRASDRVARITRWDTLSAIEMLENAVRLDPQFAQAWAQLAQAALQMGLHFDPVSRWTRRAEQAARRALRLDGDNPDARCAWGQTLWSPLKKFKNRQALRELRQAVRVKPNHANALRVYAGILFHVGLLEEAQQRVAECLEVNPDDPWTLSTRGHVALYRAAYDEANEMYTRALLLDPTNLFANVFHPLSALYAGRLDRGEELLRSAQKLAGPDPLVVTSFALLWAKRGEKQKATQLLRRALRRGKSLLHTHHANHIAAAAFSVLGKKAEAVQQLRIAAKTGLPNLPVFREDPHLVLLRGFAPYEKLLLDLKKEWASYHREFGRANST